MQFQSNEEEGEVQQSWFRCIWVLWWEPGTSRRVGVLQCCHDHHNFYLVKDRESRKMRKSLKYCVKFNLREHARLMWGSECGFIIRRTGQRCSARISGEWALPRPRPGLAGHGTERWAGRPEREPESWPPAGPAGGSPDTEHSSRDTDDAVILGCKYRTVSKDIYL